jgi:hypothetical protein
MSEQVEMTQEEALAQVQAMINPVEETPHDPPTEKIGAGTNAQQIQASEEETPQAEGQEEGTPPEAGAQAEAEGAEGGDHQEDDSAAARYNAQVQRLLAQNREAVQRRHADTEQKEQSDLAQRLIAAKKYGAQAVLQELGVEAPKEDPKPEYDVRELLGLDGDQDPKDKTLAALESKMETLQKAFEAKQAEIAAAEQERQAKAEQEQMWQWEVEEFNKIQGFLNENDEKYTYVNALKKVGSEQDIFNGIIGLYRQGIEPKYEDVADLVEARVEAVAELLIDTPKFRKLLESKGVKIRPAAQPSATLTGNMSGNTATALAEQPEETEEENLRRSMEAALAAQESVKASRNA